MTIIQLEALWVLAYSSSYGLTPILYFLGGDGGIRTLGTLLEVHLFSKEAHSTTLTRLHVLIYNIKCINLIIDLPKIY